MTHLVIVDNPYFAKRLAYALQHEMSAQIVISAADAQAKLPTGALLFIELWLPERQCGIALARQLQLTRPDLTPIVWGADPSPFYLWATAEYKLPGFLDKAMSDATLQAWVRRAVEQHTAWPGELLAQARTWEIQVATRLRTLPENLWRVWMGLLRQESNRELMARLRLSERTIERQLTNLYIALGVQGRAEAMNIAWEWNLVRRDMAGLDWSALAYDLFPIPSKIGRCMNNEKYER